jgi:hypothetical protein
MDNSVAQGLLVLAAVLGMELMLVWVLVLQWESALAKVLV